MNRNKKLTEKVSRAGTAFVRSGTIKFRLDGAAYHLSIIREIIQSKILGHSFENTQQDASIMRWHLASFYFELVATFDCALQVFAAHKKLGLDRRNITWMTCNDQCVKRGIQDQLTQKFKEVNNSDWFLEILARRNYVSHRSDAFVQVLQVKGEIVAVGTVRQPDLIKACEADLEPMRSFVDLAISNLPSEDIFFS